MSIENNTRRRSPKLLCEVLKSKNVVCMPNYNVINSYLPFSFFSFFYDNVIAIRYISISLYDLACNTLDRDMELKFNSLFILGFLFFCFCLFVCCCFFICKKDK